AAWIEPSVAIAASRAGGIGVLDLQYSRDERGTLEALGKLAESGSGSIGLKLDGSEENFAASILSQLPEKIELVIITSCSGAFLDDVVHDLHRRDVRILLEATSLLHARMGEESGVDGITIKGHEAGGKIGEETTFILLQRVIDQI